MLACALGQSSATAFPPPLWAKAAHISDSRDRELRRCVPHGSLPPCGGGTGRGVATGTARDVAFASGHCTSSVLEQHLSSIGSEAIAGFCYTPLPVPPPPGGRERCGTVLLHLPHLVRVLVQDVCMPFPQGGREPCGTHLRNSRNAQAGPQVSQPKHVQHRGDRHGLELGELGQRL